MAIIWREYRGISQTGKPYTQRPHYPSENGKESGDLLFKLLRNMPKEGRKKLSYDEACHKVAREVCDSIDARRHKFLWWLVENWVQWLTDQGFYVEFTEKDFYIVLEEVVA